MMKKFAGFILCLMLFCVTILSGCDLITTNVMAYRNAVVATAVDKSDSTNKITVTKYELEQMYQSYSAYAGSGYDKNEIVDTCLKTLINNKILLKEAEKKGLDQFDDKETAYVWNDVITSLESNIQNYGGVQSNQSSTSSASRQMQNYKPRAVYQKTGSTFEILRQDSEIPQRTIDGFDYQLFLDKFNSYKQEVEEAGLEMLSDEIEEQYKQYAYSDIIDMKNVNDDYEKGYNSYLNALKRSETGLGLSKDDREVFLREIDRLYKVCKESYILTKYQEQDEFVNYNKVSNVTVGKMLELYTSKVRRAYTEYVLEGAVDTYISDMEDDCSSVYYYLDGATDTKFFQVAHILIKYNDVVTKDGYEAKKAEFGASGNGSVVDQDTYQQQLTDYLNGLKPIVRHAEKDDDGNVIYNTDGSVNYVEYDDTYSRASYEEGALSLARYIKETIDGETSVDAKLEKFKEFVFEYNDDDGMITAINTKGNYAIGVNANEAEPGQDYKVYSGMVEPFTDAAVELYKTGKVGAVSDYVVSDYGVHVLIYLGPINNIFSVSDNFVLTNEPDAKGKTAIERLAETKINIFSDKTYFDVLYDELASLDESSYNQIHVETLRSNYKIEYNKNNYEDLL